MVTSTEAAAGKSILLGPGGAPAAAAGGSGTAGLIGAGGAGGQPGGRGAGGIPGIGIIGTSLVIQQNRTAIISINLGHQTILLHWY